MMMNLVAAATAIAVSATLALAGCASGTTGEEGAIPGMGSSSSSVDVVGVNGADVNFTMAMIAHHEQAVEMAGLMLDKISVDPRVIDLADEIKAGQGAEIEQLHDWLEEWGVPRSRGVMEHGEGMMSNDDMAALGAASGLDASTVFLEQMVVHHEGAVDMAQSEVDAGEYSEAVVLAQSVVDGQTAEIQRMQDILSTL